MMVETAENPSISIVTVVWNNLPGLEFTAASVASQDYDKVEHLVVDGDSTDGTLDWLRAQPQGHSIIWHSEPDDGIYDAMNKGLSRATGELVLFLNGGDSLSSPDVLSTIARDWQERGWVWGYGGLRYIDGQRLPIREYAFSPFSRRRLARAQGFVPHPATFARTDVMRDMGGFRQEFGFSADQEFMVRIAANHEPRVFEKVLTDYLIDGAHGASTYSDTARRYQKIRQANDLTVSGIAAVDSIYTKFQAANWKLRAQLSSLRKRVGSR